VVLSESFKSPTIVLQSIGRGTRLSEGKEGLVVYDFRSKGYAKENNLDYNYMNWTELELRHNRMLVKVKTLHSDEKVLVMDTNIDRKYVDDVAEIIDDLWLDFNVENSLLTFNKDTEIIDVSEGEYEATSS
jgi:superfamily II DNA or RNA helicase